LRVIAWSAALVPLVISLLKQNSDAHCPWDLARYGGAQPYVRPFDTLPLHALPGHCLPAGHASSALWLISLAVLWLPGEERKAWRAAGTALALGLAVGWMQQMRGAHFLTHTLCVGLHCMRYGPGAGDAAAVLAYPRCSGGSHDDHGEPKKSAS
jgi:membrane-associated PAP2 superfamily phosphatase